MSGIILKLFLVAAATLFVIFSAIGVFRRARKLDTRIKAFKEEQAELKRLGKVSDPYADLAELYSDKK